MDFSVDQQNEIRFMYVLPFSKNKALVEYTLFSSSTIEDDEYETEIKNYLKINKILDYNVLEKEKGVIPMTCYPFFKKNTDSFFKIGTAGGWTKPSTGYTVKNSIDKIDLIISYLKKDKPLSKINFKNRFWYYDLLFLDVLIDSKGKGSKVFSDLFKNNDPIRIFKFLDEKTSFTEELSIFLSVNVVVFVKSLIKRISNFSI
jgi:lycopene beta-cyclase